jgi:methionine sulfoxide reductase heme-binding subunit
MPVLVVRRLNPSMQNEAPPVVASAVAGQKSMRNQSSAQQQSHRISAWNINSWGLFWLLAAAITVADLLGLPFADFRSARGMEFIIKHSVRCALPLFLLAFTASSFAALWNGPLSRWLLSNRRYFGLAFAYGMAVHFAFVGYSVLSFGNGLNATVTTFDLTAAWFLLAMTLTSFRWFARRLSLADWRRLHKAGAYAIWLLATYIYVSDVRYERDVVHALVASVFLAAWILRVAAWARHGWINAVKRSMRS